MRILIVFYLMQSHALVSYQNKLADRFQSEGHETLLHIHPESNFVSALDVDRVLGPAPSPLLPDILASILLKAKAEECDNIVFDLRSCPSHLAGCSVWPQELWHAFQLTQTRPQGWLRNAELAEGSLPRIFGLTDVSAPWDFNDQPALHRILPRLFKAIESQQLAVA